MNAQNANTAARFRSPRVSGRIARLAAATLSGGLLAATAMAGSGTVAAAVASAPPAATITFTSHVYLSPEPDGTAPFLLVADYCSLRTATGATMPCSFVGVGEISSPAGGTARGIVVTRDRVITLDEKLNFTGPTTSVGTGPATQAGLGGLQNGSFAGNFVATPTAANPNVLDDSGTITVTL